MILHFEIENITSSLLSVSLNLWRDLGVYLWSHWSSQTFFVPASPFNAVLSKTGLPNMRTKDTTSEYTTFGHRDTNSNEIITKYFKYYNTTDCRTTKLPFGRQRTNQYCRLLLVKYCNESTSPQLWCVKSNWVDSESFHLKQTSFIIIPTSWWFEQGTIL